MKKANPMIERIKKTHPQLVRGIPDGRLAKLAKAIFASVSDSLVGLEKGPLKVPGLGTFRVRTVEIEKDNRRYSAKRIRFALPQTAVSSNRKE
jgi:hypothetical protein